MAGYGNRPEETARVLDSEGWLSTGDGAYMDAEGFFYLVDRLKELVNVGGFKVYPSEVEACLSAHPAVAEAAVVGLPEPARGEQPVAVVVLKPGAEVTAKQLQAHCRQTLADFKVPTAIHFRQEPLPRTAIGKLLRREVKAELEGQAD